MEKRTCPCPSNLMHFHNTSTTPSPDQSDRPEGDPARPRHGGITVGLLQPLAENVYRDKRPWHQWKTRRGGAGKVLRHLCRNFWRLCRRFPPRPKTPEQLQMLNGTAIDFLRRHDIELLYPLMYQFFVLQGMGLLKEMSAYYMLKWCNPTSMQGGGFGNKEYPLPC